jgi:O-antigen ligase
VALIAAVFFLMSNPLVFIPTFYESLDRAVLLTEIVAVLSLPWLRLPRVPWPWVAFLGLCLLSQLWTINDVHTDISNVVYLKVSAIAFVMAANCQPVVVAWGLSLGGVSVMVLSVQAYLQEMPGASAASVGGATFTGVGTNENILAYTLVVSLAATLALARRRPLGAQVLWVLVLLINLSGLYLAQSGSGFMTTLAIALAVLALVAWPRVRAARRRHSWALAAGIGGAVLIAGASVLVVLNIQLSTFSGRAPLWRAAFDSTWDKAPLIGSGWGAVWEHPWDPTPPNDVAADIYTRAGYALSHGHNFFVDVLPELGLLGVAFAVVMVGYAIREVRRTGLHAPSRDPLAGRLLLLVLVALVVFGITEPMLTIPIGWWSLALVVALPRQPSSRPVPDGTPTGRGRRAAR